MLKRSRISRIGREIELLQLVRRVLRLALLAQAVALDGLGEDHGGLALVLHRRRVGGVDLVRIVAAAVQAPDVLVGHARDHLQQLRVLAEEVLAHEGAVVGLVVLVLAVDGLLHDAQQQAFLVAREQRIPVRAPDQLDDVPAGAAEVAFELLDDLAVAAHRAVEALQVAVDDEDQVVELLARGQADRAERFRLVHLAVAAEHPDLAVLGVGEAARMQVLQVARHVDRLDRPQAHRHGRELPEVRHQPGMRIGRHALAVDLAAEVEQLLLGEAAFEQARARRCRATNGPGNRPGRRRAPRAARARNGSGRCRTACPPRRSSRCGRRARRRPCWRLRHHHHRVPAAVGADALLERVVARRALLHVRRNRVDVRRVRASTGCRRPSGAPSRSAARAGSARAPGLRARAPPRAHRATPGFRARRDRWRRAVAGTADMVPPARGFGGG